MSYTHWLPNDLGASSDAPSRLGDMNSPRSIRCNNPGAIKDFGSDWKGRISVDWETTHCVFSTPEFGFRAMAKNIRNGYWKKRGLNTIRKMIERYAPRSADNNQTDHYINWLSRRLNWDVDAILPNTPETLAPLCAAMCELESGESNPYSKQQITDGVAAAFEFMELEEPRPYESHRQLHGPTPPKPKDKPKHDPALDSGPLLGKRTITSSSVTAVALAGERLGGTLLDKSDNALILEVFSTLKWLGIGAMVLFFALKCLRIYRDKNRGT